MHYHMLVKHLKIVLAGKNYREITNF